MSERTVNNADVYPGPVMSEAEAQAWNSLSRDEQVKRTEQVLTDARNSGLNDRTMDDIRISARKKIAERK